MSKMASADKRRRKRKLIAIFGSVCYLCRRDLLDAEITLDHVVPTSKGGRNNLDNLRIACSDCNNAKGDELLVTPNEFAATKIVTIR